MDFKVGDHVELHYDSVYWDFDEPTNPRRMPGIIVEVNRINPPTDLIYKVIWLNGNKNSYALHDLRKSRFSEVEHEVLRMVNGI